MILEAYLNGLALGLLIGVGIGAVAVLAAIVYPLKNNKDE